MTKEEIINIIQEGIDRVQESDNHCITTYEWKEINAAFADMAEWYRHQKDDFDVWEESGAADAYSDHQR